MIDTLAEKDNSISMTPYHYVSNNPINAIDGEDYILIIDLSTNTVIVRANYYSSQEDLKYVEKATEYWNDKIGEFFLKIKINSRSSKFKVNFNLSVQESTDV